GRGHPGITGTHDKTLELTRDRNVTKRATCVLGVASDHDDAALLALRGDVEVTLACGALRDSFVATVTPFFLGDNSLVFRRGPALRGRTFASGATKTAADIDRALVKALGERDAELHVTLNELGRGGRRGALFVVAGPIGDGDGLLPPAPPGLGGGARGVGRGPGRFRDLATRARMHVTARVDSLHEHNENARAEDALAALASGARVALVSDAGTPMCSDPGYVVVQRAVTAGLDVSPVPGPSSLLAVLSVAALPVDRFLYVGFLPRRAAARQAQLRELAELGVTFVCHEAPHRVHALLGDLAAVCPDWNLCVGREVTKVFEEFRRGSAVELAAELSTEESRGE